jgi:hypothetical protein
MDIGVLYPNSPSGWRKSIASVHFARYDARADQNFGVQGSAMEGGKVVDVVNQVLLREPDGHGPEKSDGPVACRDRGL